MHRFALLLTVGPVALAGCGSALEEDEACDLAVAWIEKEGFPTVSGGMVDDWEFDSCLAFRTQEEEGGALIDVKVARTIAERTEDGDVNEVVTKPEATCALIEYDQGWRVEACLPL